MNERDDAPLVRNVLEVFNERDQSKRLAHIEQLFTEDAVFNEAPDATFRGLKSINVHVTELQKTIDPSLRFRPGTHEQAADLARVAWTLQAEGGPVVASGMDIGVLENGRIAKLYTFLNVPTSNGE